MRPSVTLARIRPGWWHKRFFSKRTSVFLLKRGPSTNRMNPRLRVESDIPPVNGIQGHTYTKKEGVER